MPVTEPRRYIRQPAHRRGGRQRTPVHGALKIDTATTSGTTLKAGLRIGGCMRGDFDEDELDDDDVTDQDMRLPEAFTCSDCAYFRRCLGLIDVKGDERFCDWAPSRFKLAKAGEPKWIVPPAGSKPGLPSCEAHGANFCKECGKPPSALSDEPEEAYGYLVRLFRRVAPQCEPLGSVIGLATQIDNYIAGLHADRAADAGTIKLANATLFAYTKAVMAEHEDVRVRVFDAVRAVIGDSNGR